MNSLDLFLVQYGLAAIFILLLVKTIGLPIPIPADLIILTAAARVAQGKLNPWQTFIAIFVALVIGGLIQFIMARGPVRGILYRFGRYVGLTAPRLDAASDKVNKGGALSVGIAILVPGVRGAAIVASGLADMSLLTFLAGLVLGSLAFIGLHFFLGYLGGSLLPVVSHVLPMPWLILLTIALLLAIFGLWVIIRRRRKTAQNDVDGTSTELWHEGICPACLALYAANQLHPSNTGKSLFSDTIHSNQAGRGSLTHGSNV